MMKTVPFLQALAGLLASIGAATITKGLVAVFLNEVTIGGMYHVEWASS